MTLEGIKQAYARTHGYESFEHLYTMCDMETFNKHIGELIRICQSRFIDNVISDNLKTNHLMSYDGLANAFLNKNNLIK